MKRLLEAHTGVEWTEEHKFDPKRRWRFDYAQIDLKIAIEIEGGVWINGRHTRGSGYLSDMEKYNAAQILGWRVFRFPPQFVDKMIETVKEALKA